MGKQREGMGAAITGFVTVPTAVPCLTTLPFIHFQPSDLQSILHLNLSHGFTQQLREGLGNQSPLLRSIVSRTNSVCFSCWIPGLESPHPKDSKRIVR